MRGPYGRVFRGTTSHGSSSYWEGCLESCRVKPIVALVECDRNSREQDGQRDEGIFDPDVLASVYIAAIGQCQVEAQLMGSKDEKDTRESEAAVLPDKPSKKLETGVCSPLRVVNKNMRLRKISPTNAAA